MNRQSLVLVWVGLMWLAGCAGAAAKDLSGQTLPAKSPDQVKLYQKKPDKYDIVGSVSIPLSSDLTSSANPDATSIVTAMKSAAAAMGADGLLFQVDPSEYDVVVTAGYQHRFYQLPIHLQPQRTAVAKAILIK